VFLGAVEEEITLHADVIGRSDVGGWGGYLQARYARHREHHLAEHARRTVEHLWAIDKSRPLHSIVLAGPDEGLAVLRRALPKALANCVVADVALEMWVPAADVVKRIEEIDAQAREREDRELVARVADEASAPGSYATVGWDDALQALAQGRVHRLVLPRGARIAGVECREGHFLAVSPASACPLCGARPEPVEDVVEPAIRMAMHTDALVHFVAPGATEALAKHGAAALLRY
jgi:peptide subunit release factor 1 (eRF1)